MILFVLFLFLQCSSLSFQSTEPLVMIAGEIVGSFLLRCGDDWAKAELQDEDVNWEDVVADLYLELREEFKLNKKQEDMLKKQITDSLVWIRKTYQKHEQKRLQEE